jgi:uncharacterized alpha-E superfamily protein
MLSRIADSLFWITRYVERADGMLRMLKINYASSLDKSTSEEFSWKPVLKVFTLLDDATIASMEHDSHAVLHYMIDDKTNTNSVVYIITRSRENARGVQDHITLEVWECLNDFYHAVKSDKVAKAIDSDETLSMLSDLIKHGLVFYGTADITMARGQGWLFMNLGKFIERALQTADILDVKFSDISYNLNSSADTPYWKYLLMSVSGYELYLKTYRTGVQNQNVVDQMVLNIDFPRSILYSLIQIGRNFKKLRSDRNLENYSQIDFLIGRLRSRVQYSNIEYIEQTGLHSYLTEIRNDLYVISNAVNNFYFSHQ